MVEQSETSATAAMAYSVAQSAGPSIMAAITSSGMYVPAAYLADSVSPNAGPSIVAALKAMGIELPAPTKEEASS